jgi:hypothetical protein
VIFFLENVEVGVAEYRRLCVENRKSAVVEQDKSDLKKFLTGVIDTCSQIDHAVAEASAKLLSAQQKSSQVESTKNDVTISLEEMREQRERHAALIEQSIHRPATSSQPR